MSLAYGDVLTAARDSSVWFDHSRTPGGVAARMASDIQRDLIAKLVKRDAERLSTTTSFSGATVVAALGTPPVAVALPAALQYVRANFVIAGSSLEPPVLRMTVPGRLATTDDVGWYVQGANAYFTGVASQWSNIGSVIVTYVPLPVDVVAETDVLAIPGDGKGAFKARLAYAFALRVNGMPASTEEPDMTQVIQLDVSAFASEADKAEAAWLAQASDQRRRAHLTIRNGADLLP